MNHRSSNYHRAMEVALQSDQTSQCTGVHAPNTGSFHPTHFTTSACWCNIINGTYYGGRSVSARIMHPDNKWLEEFNKLEDKNLESVIFSHQYYIDVETSEVNDILHELDNTKNLYEEFVSYRVSVSRLQKIINRRKKDMSLEELNEIFLEFRRQLEKIDKERRILREKALSYHR